MLKSKRTSIIVLISIFAYFLFSQFYLKSFGNLYVYIINPLFFLILAIILKYINQTITSSRYKKRVLNYLLISALAYIVINILSGLLFSFGKNPYSTNIKGIALNFYSIGLVIFLREYIRYKLINNVFKRDKQLIYILIVIVFAFQDISIVSIYENFSVYYVFKYIFAIIIPTIVKNCLFTYTAKYTDYIPAVVYEAILCLTQWILPILPNAEWIFYAVIDSVIPLIALFYCMYEISTKDKEHMLKKEIYMKPAGIVPWAVVIVVVVWFGIGIFPIKPIGIMTGSMSPYINIGDMVIIQKCNIKDINIDDIIEYKRENYTVVHRVINKYEKDGKIYVITKGDNNQDRDNDPVEEKQVEGKVIAVIPYLAMPKVWINNLRHNQLNVDIELGR